jgi:hypothetical protein
MATPTSLSLNQCDYIPWGYLKGKLFQKKIAHNSGTENSHQLRDQINFTEILAKILNNSVLHLHKIRYLAPNQHVLVQQPNIRV